MKEKKRNSNYVCRPVQGNVENIFISGKYLDYWEYQNKCIKALNWRGFMTTYKVFRLKNLKISFPCFDFENT